jgi:RNA recognition motif-containing protein
VFFGETSTAQASTNQTQSVELMNIYVANVPYTVRDQELRELFEPFGEVTSAKIIMDKATNRSRGFGFVEMANDDAGRAAIEGTNGKNFHGRDLVVNEARPRTEGDRGGFGGGGNRSGGGDRGGYRSDRGGSGGGDRGGYRSERPRRDEY